MPPATKKKHAYAKVARRHFIPKPRDLPERGLLRDLVTDCLWSRGVPLGERRTRRCMEAYGAAILILREHGYSLPEIARAIGFGSHSGIALCLEKFAAKLHAEDRAKCESSNPTLDITPATR